MFDGDIMKVGEYNTGEEVKRFTTLMFELYQIDFDIKK